MIEIQQLTKRYGALTALDGLTVSIDRGTVFGFVGQNGAGKTTMFLILATLLSPTAGDARIGGFSVVDEPNRVRRHIGFMPDFFGVYDQLKAYEYLDFYGASYGIPPRERKRLIPQLLELVNLSEKSDSYVDNLSRGMKQRLCLARALIHDPEVLILDEPASGLDPRARVEMKAIIRELKIMGKTILISSHILPELAEMCDEVGIIDRGRLLLNGPVPDILRKMTGQKTIFVRISTEMDRAVAFFEDEPQVGRIEKEPKTGTIQFLFDGDDEMQRQLLKRALEAGIPIISFHDEEKKLEEAFIEILKGSDANGTVQ